MAKKEPVQKYEANEGRNRYKRFVNDLEAEQENYAQPNYNMSSNSNVAQNNEYPMPQYHTQNQNYENNQDNDLSQNSMSSYQQIQEQYPTDNMSYYTTYPTTPSYPQNYGQEVSNNYPIYPQYTNDGIPNNYSQQDYPIQNHFEEQQNIVEQQEYSNMQVENNPQFNYPQANTINNEDFNSITENAAPSTYDTVPVEENVYNTEEIESSVVRKRKEKERQKEKNFQYPSMGIRFKASLIDFLISLVAGMILFFKFLFPTILNVYNLYNQTGGKTYLDLAWNVKGQIFAYILFLLIINLFFQFIIPILLKGQTIGKKIMKIRIVSNYIDETDVPTPIQILKREVLGKAVGFLSFGLCFIPSKKKEFNQAFPDNIANTHIVFGEAN